MLEVLACPACREPFTLVGSVERSGDVIESATLRCAGCERTYPVHRGIPRLAPADDRFSDPEARTQSHFTHEFTALAEGDRDIDPPELVEYYFYSRTGLDPELYRRLPGDPGRTSLPTGPDAYRADPSFLAGKRVLDAGCGPGRFTRVAAAGASEVIGLDLGEHVDRAAARCADLPNVELVQGSVLDPPFRPGTFDYVFSVGVLHHTPDPRRGCHELAKLLTPEGALSVWVYPPEYWNGRLRGAVGRSVHAKLSTMSPERSMAVCARWLYPLGRVQMALADTKWGKVVGAPIFLLSVPRHPQREVMIATIHDYYGPPIISTHTYDEVRSWLEEIGFQNLRQVPVPTAWFAESRRTA